MSTTAHVNTREIVKDARGLRALWRYVLHRIVVHSDTITYGAQCLVCEWTVQRNDDAAMHLACMRHTGRNPDHTAFWTYCRAMAYVQLVDKESRQ
ncbi:hypothetical protein [Streptomyces sp. NPDC000405]|uniref:DUF7848 domain-containing protein n=1 Tax=Streptomyces sp. NPDC000405 TaxID=3161033 RepID=UPI00398C9203